MKNLTIFVVALISVIALYADTSCDGNWGHDELHEFLTDLPSRDIEQIAVGLEIVDKKTARKTPNKDLVVYVEKEIIWLSSNVLTYGFRSNKVDYHETVKWVAWQIGVEKDIIEECSTFIIEKAILEKLFIDAWDQLSQEQRRKVLEDLNELSETQRAGLVVAGGRTALSLLSATVYFSGFSFYTTMSSVMASIAGVFGVTLPFSVYTSASSLVATLSGPVGWAIIGVSTVVSTAMLGAANEKKTAGAILQIHILRAKALRQQGKRIPEVPRTE